MKKYICTSLYGGVALAIVIAAVTGLVDHPTPGKEWAWLSVGLVALWAAVHNLLSLEKEKESNPK